MATTTMRAAVYYGAGDIRLEDVDRPTRGDGECLILVTRSGMCGTDAGEWVSGPRVFPVKTPHPVSGHVGPMILGHEFIGEVVEADPDAPFAVGDRVATGAGISCGHCARCLEGRTNQCKTYRTLGLNLAGGMAEYASVPSSTLAAIAPTLADDHAALAQPLAVGIHAARRSGVKDGDRVVVIGAGAIGSFVLAGLKHLFTADVAVVDFPGARLERADRLGADHTIAASDNLLAAVEDAFDGLRPDVVIEASGAPGQLQAALDIVVNGGRVLGVGIPKEKPTLDVHSMVFREITLETTLAHVCSTDLPAALEILSATRLGAELSETARPLDQLPNQLDRLASGKIEGKVLFDPRLS